ncbi:AAA family ATPase [Peptoniphilus rhinitidis]|uniref:AAA family ATPase n=1 Tax=Peptoniphilus rhinitidis TaxID=1175452 RepID=UPI002901353F|nr:AAA family ATPase [Peptoniphilus rhinitidis]MDU1044171.1 AAA family ATPase [Peptoniphilus rhinitidis]MDU3751334.1 AAA family ATPase [Peptoniphilus rhinitidis]
MRKFLLSQGISKELLNDVDEFIEIHDLNKNFKYRIPKIKYKYYGKKTWEKAIVAILSGENILLSGPKATGKNVLAENLAYLFKRPLWTISLNISSDPANLIGSDTFKNNEVTLKKGPVYEAAEQGGFAVFDEINMAKNEALSVVHSTLDYRRVLDISGYDRLNLHDATRFIATMNYGYIGTRDLNEALVSRFLVIDMPTISENDLAKLFKENTKLNNGAIKIFTKLFLDLQEKSLNSEISSKSIDLRGLLSSIELMNRGLDIKDSLELGIVDKTFDDYEREIVTDVIDTLFSKNMDRADLFE